MQTFWNKFKRLLLACLWVLILIIIELKAERQLGYSDTNIFKMTPWLVAYLSALVSGSLAYFYKLGWKKIVLYSLLGVLLGPQVGIIAIVSYYFLFGEIQGKKSHD